LGCQETVQRYENLLRTAVRFNKFLLSNEIMSISQYPEIESIFLALCEKSRMINDQSPSAMKILWLCFSSNLIDDGSCAEVRLQLNMNGPLSDLNLFKRKRDRETVFTNKSTAVLDQLQLQKNDYPNINWNKLNPNLHLQACHDMAKEIGRLHGIIKGDATRIEDCAKLEPDAMMTKLLEHGRPKLLENCYDFFHHRNMPLVIVNEEGYLGSVKFEDGNVVEAQTPPWLTDMVLFREGRRVAFGDKSQNNMIEKHTDRHRHKQQAVADYKITRNSRFYENKRKNDYFQSKREEQGQSRSYDRPPYNRQNY